MKRQKTKTAKMAAKAARRWPKPKKAPVEPITGQEMAVVKFGLGLALVGSGLLTLGDALSSLGIKVTLEREPKNETDPKPKPFVFPPPLIGTVKKEDEDKKND